MPASPSAFLVPRSRSHISSLPRTVSVQQGGAAFLSDDNGRLVLADLAAPRLGLRGAQAPATRLTAALNGLLPVNIESTQLWVAEVDGLSHVSGFVDNLTPSTGAWGRPGRVDSVTVTAVDKGRNVTAAYWPARAEMTPGEAAQDFLHLLIVCAKKSELASFVVSAIFRGQQIEILTPEPGLRLVGYRNAPTELPTSGAYRVVWNRSRFGHPMFVLEPGARSLRAVTRNRPANAASVSTGSISEACDLLDAECRDLVTTSGLFTVSEQDAGPPYAVAVPGVDVRVERRDWLFSKVDGVFQSGVSVGPRLLAVDGDHRLVIELSSGVRLTDLLDLLAETGRRSRHLPVSVPLEQPGVTASVGIAGGRERAVKRLALLAPARQAGAAGSRRNDDLGGWLDELSVAAVRAPLVLDGPTPARLGDAELRETLARRDGGLIVAYLGLQAVVRSRDAPAGGLGTTDFADALTTYVAERNRLVELTTDDLRATVVALVVRWLGKQPHPARATVITSGMVAGHAREEWARLLTAAPWLLWFLELDPPRQNRRSLTPQELADVLALVRPRQDPRRAFGRSDQPAFPGRWWNLYLLPAARNLRDETLTALATALETALADPAAASIGIQGLPLPAAVRGPLIDVLASWGGDEQQEPTVLGVLAGGAGSDILLVNTTASRHITVDVGADSLRLAPMALTIPHAVDYVAPRLVPSSVDIRVGGTPLDLRAEDPGIAEGVSFTNFALGEWFRGRTEQVAALGMALERHELRPASVVFGPRRAGKSTLAWHMGDDRRAAGRLFIDMSSTRTTIQDFADWNASAVDNLVRQARVQLRVTVPGNSDFVDALQSLDDLLEGRSPTVVVLDELDVLLGPESSEARRTAGRLGSTMFRNIAVIGTMQRFHHSAQEFKAWQHVACPPDLRWADGVTYFMDVLREAEPPSRVVHLRRSAAGPREFATCIHPRIGLRPYFWGQLRHAMEGRVRGGVLAHRLLGAVELGALIDGILLADGHLRSIFDRDPGLSPEEVKRRDYFSTEERIVLARFSLLLGSATSIPTSTVPSSLDDAVRDLIDRGFVRDTGQGSLDLSVPLYLEFLRARSRDLLATLASEGVAPEEIHVMPHESTSTAGGPRGTALLPTWSAPGREALVQEIDELLARKGCAAFGEVATRVRRHLPGEGWGAHGNFARWLGVELSQYPVTRWPYAEGTVWASAEVRDAAERDGEEFERRVRALAAPPTVDFDLDRVREAMTSLLVGDGPYLASTVAVAVRSLVPKPAWAGVPSFSRWLKRHLPEFPYGTFPYQAGTVWRDRAAMTAWRPPPPADPNAAPGTPAVTKPVVRTVVPPEVRGAVAQRLDAAFTGRTHWDVAQLGPVLRPSAPAPGWLGRTLMQLIAECCPERPVTRFPFQGGTVWVGQAAMEAAHAAIYDDGDVSDPVEALQSAESTEALDAALRRLITGLTPPGGSVSVKSIAHICRTLPVVRGRSVQAITDVIVAAVPGFTALYNGAGDLHLCRPGADGTVAIGPLPEGATNLDEAVTVVLEVVGSSSHAVPLPQVADAVRERGLMPPRVSGAPSPQEVLLAAVIRLTDLSVERLPYQTYLRDPGRHRRPDA